MIKIDGEMIYLKEISKKDAIKLHEYTKQPELNKFSGPYKASESIKKALEYIKDSRKNILEKKSYIFGIYKKDSNEFIGTIGFFNLDKKNRSGEIGFWIAKNYWNKGYMTEAVKIMTNYIFKILKYYRVFAHFHELNKAVERVLIKAGYKKEKVIRKAIKYGNKRYDEIIYSKIKQKNAYIR